MQERGPVDLQGGAMRILASRVCSFKDLLIRIDLEHWRVRQHNDMNYTFIPLKYWGGD